MASENQISTSTQTLYITLFRTITTNTVIIVYLIGLITTVVVETIHSADDVSRVLWRDNTKGYTHARYRIKKFKKNEKTNKNIFKTLKKKS